MKVAITGASGFIGLRLLDALKAHSVVVLSRRKDAQLPAGVSLAVWDTAGPPPLAALAGTDLVIHLAGEPVAQRWTEAVKARIRDSRVSSTRVLVQGLAQLNPRPGALICASAIGYYGSRGDEILTESSAPGSGFLPEVCVEWEREADAAEAFGMRVVKVRTGVVLAPHGGALRKMLPPFRAGVGGPLGSGKQWMSWIHLDDMVNLIRHAADTSVRGALNATAPNPVTNAEFTRKLANVLHRPALLPVPAFGLRFLFGDMAEVLLGSQRVIPSAAEKSGFRFEYPQLEPALRSLLQ